MKRIDFLQAALGASAFVGLSLAACNDKDNLQELVNNTRLKVNGNMFNFSSNKLEKVRNVYIRSLNILIKYLIGIFIFIKKHHYDFLSINVIIRLATSVFVQDSMPCKPGDELTSKINGPLFDLIKSTPAIVNPSIFAALIAT